MSRYMFNFGETEAVTGWDPDGDTFFYQVFQTEPHPVNESDVVTNLIAVNNACSLNEAVRAVEHYAHLSEGDAIDLTALLRSDSEGLINISLDAFNDNG